MRLSIYTKDYKCACGGWDYGSDVRASYVLYFVLLVHDN